MGIKKVLLIAVAIQTFFLLLMFWSSTAAWGAGPYLVCDPQDGVTYYRYVVGDELIIEPAQADGSFKHDLTDWPTGVTNSELNAGAPWALDGIPTDVIEWSDPRPFVLGRPSVPQSPLNIGLKE